MRRAEERDKPAVTEQIIVLFFIAFVIFLFFQVIAFLGACTGLIKGLGLEADRKTTRLQGVIFSIAVD